MIGAFENLSKAKPDSLNAIYERPDPLDLIIFNVVDSRTRAQTSYLLVQSNNMIVEQQRLQSEQISAQKQLID
jgi:hypothetical protein